MMKSKPRASILCTGQWVLAAALTLSPLTSMSRSVWGGGGFEIRRYTVDGGGVVGAVGGGFKSSATVGQPDVGRMSGDGFTLTGGFWHALLLGDCDGDGHVDLVDFDAFLGCVTGPGGDSAGPQCACFDFDSDADVDLGDFAVLQETFTG